MTPERGPSALQALRSVRAFYTEISRLIRTADHWVGVETGWRPIGSAVLRDLSYQLGLPDRWQPEAVDRWYSTHDPHVAAYLAVLLLPRDAALRFDEPLFTSGWVRMVQPVVSEVPARWLSYFAMWNDVPYDGTFHDVQLSEPYGRQAQRFAARPLFDLASTEDLVRMVLQPLVAEVPGGERPRGPTPVAFESGEATD